jgi:hypothetical protein
MTGAKLQLDPRRRPNLLGIGAAKCGTTWFASILSHHPNVFMPPQKELNALYYNDLDSRLREYEAYFRGGEEALIRCDFSVRYLSMPNSPSAAARYVPDAKIIAILRDPVDQVQSHYWHHRRQNFAEAKAVLPAPDIFEALERFPNLLLEPALYGKHIQRWRAHYPDSQIMLLNYRDVTQDLPGVLARLWAFLELQPPPKTLIEPGLPDRGGRRGVSPRGGALGRLYPTLYSAVTHGPYQSLKRMIGVRCVEAVKRMLKLREAAEAVFFKTGYPKLAPDERARLRAVFANDLAVLHEQVGFAPAARWRDAT